MESDRDNRVSGEISARDDGPTGNELLPGGGLIEPLPEEDDDELGSPLGQALGPRNEKPPRAPSPPPPPPPPPSQR